MKEKAAVAVSGGVDSLCAMLLLKRQGYDLIALHALLKETDSADSAEARELERICHDLGASFHIIDLRAAFAEKVLAPFAIDYAAGKTPNPCALCNRRIKFGLLAEAAFGLGANRMATGHYASLVRNPYGDGFLLACAEDQGKDQSYFLARISPTILPRLIFPCARLRKTEIRSLVKAAGLEPPAPEESQDLCFSGSGWHALVQSGMEKDAAACKAGDVLLRQEDGSLKKVGRHTGLWQYTYGQRRGLGFSGPEAWHVLEKRLASRELVIGPKSMLGMTALEAGDFVCFAPPALWPERLFARTRLSQKMQDIRIEFERNAMIARFPEPVFPSAQGQILAVYDEAGRVLAGAIIREIYVS